MSNSTLKPVPARVMRVLEGRAATANDFLGRFDPKRRSGIANNVLDPIRRGESDIDRILAALRKEYERRLGGRWASDDDREFYGAVLETIRLDPAAARACIRHYQEYEALGPAEKDRLREERAEAGRQAWMDREPATERQVAYLRGPLGYTGEIRGKGDASRLIDELSRKGGRQ